MEIETKKLKKRDRASEKTAIMSLLRSNIHVLHTKLDILLETFQDIIEYEFSEYVEDLDEFDNGLLEVVEDAEKCQNSQENNTNR